jgi:tRNA (guanine-N7-)-methyltransferase
MSARKRHAFDALFPSYRLDPDGPLLDLAAVFGRTAPVVLEIGFGMGDATAAIARDHPERDHIAVDVHAPGIAHLAELLDIDGRTNVRIVNGDAVEVLRDRVGDGTLAAVHVFFPDPWPKVRQHQRRLVQPAFAESVARCLVPGGELHLATDAADYAAHMVRVLDASPSFRGGAVPRPPWRPLTKYERDAIAAGRTVVDLRYVRE